MEINRDCPSTPSINDLKPPIFTPREQISSNYQNQSSVENGKNLFALNISQISEIETPLKNFSLNEQFRLERDIAHQTSIQTRESFTTTYSSLHTMISQMQLKVAAAFLQETEYLQQREQRLNYDEHLLTERIKQFEQIKENRQKMENEFLTIKDRLETAVVQVTKFQNDGRDFLQKLFFESKKIDEKLSELICESMSSLTRSRLLIERKTKEFDEKSKKVHSEFDQRHQLIRQTESTIGMMLDLVNVLNQLNNEHSQDISIVENDFQRKQQEYSDYSQTLKHNWDIENEIKQIQKLENEKHQLQEDFYHQTVLLENLKNVLAQTMIPS